MIILGLNAYHGDSSACIVIDGKLIAAVEEERYRRIKHWAGFPTEAIKYCLNEAGVALTDIDHIAVNRNPGANLLKKAAFSIHKRPPVSMVMDRIKNAGHIRDIKSTLAEEFDIRVKAKVHHIEHHIAHLASAFFVSPYDRAAVVSVDGFGDFVGTMWGLGRDNKIEVNDRVFFPHSLGIFYLAFTQLLGFPKYGDEYKVMGLAAYGRPNYIDQMQQIVTLNGDGKFELGLKFFVHHCKDITMTWKGGAPSMAPVFSDQMTKLLGPVRKKYEPVTDRCKDIAASMQTMYEKALFNLLNHIHDKLKIPTLCLAGGCAMNSVANGKIFDNTPFKEVYIQPAAGDAGGAIGAAYYLWNHILNNKRAFILEKPYLGPQFDDTEINKILTEQKNEIQNLNCRIHKIEDENLLCKTTAQHIAEGKVVGWFQGRMEWGPRALGNRSIVCDPRRSQMRDTLNLKIKRRESFRPFAPSIHADATADFFETDYPDPFMLKVYKIKPEKRKIIPAVTHVDGTGRLQTVTKQDNPLYWRLIEEFKNITGVPVVLNTSFNENEPIVCRPQEALSCFLRTKMDVLVLGNYIMERENESLNYNRCAQRQRHNRTGRPIGTVSDI